MGNYVWVVTTCGDFYPARITTRLNLCNPHQASVSYPFSSIEASINADADTDADADAQCGQGLNKWSVELNSIRLDVLVME